MKANLFEWEQLRPGFVHKITVARLEKRSRQTTVAQVQSNMPWTSFTSAEDKNVS